jgi:cyclopropane-fatty-acyl-phospholipid synthase
MRLHSDFVAPHSARSPDRWTHRLAAVLQAAGITLDGPHPWDPRIRDRRAARRILLGGTVGAGEAYMDGDWECEALDELTARLLGTDAQRALTLQAWELIRSAAAWLINNQTRWRARASVKAHYDIGNELYAAMLDPTMAYSCGYWAAATTLADAQQAKYALICAKLGLEPGMRLLDIGCGWGGLAQYAAVRHGVTVTGITLSPTQAPEARRRTAGLPVEIREQDYRDLSGTFDRVVSVGMFEHVGPANYERYFDTVRRVLVADGLFLLHSIGGAASMRTSDAWLDKYIFPGSVLPSAALITRALERRFVLEDWHNFGPDYDRTLMAWWRNFDVAWPELAPRYGARFYRMWRYYLLTCAGAFRARHNQLWQIVLSPSGVRNGYRRIAG